MAVRARGPAKPPAAKPPSRLTNDAHTDLEALEEECRQCEARSRVLEAEVKQLQAAAGGGKAGAAGSTSNGNADTPATDTPRDIGGEGRVGIRATSAAQLKTLEQQVEKARAKLQEGRQELAILLEDKRVKLAAVVESSVDGYYTESRDLKQSMHEQEVVSTGVAPPGSRLHKLRDEEAKLRRGLKERRRELAAISAELKSKTEERDRMGSLLRQRELLGIP